MVYRILVFLKKSELADEFDEDHFTATHFGLTARQWAASLERLLDDGLVKGLSVSYSGDGYGAVMIILPRITTKGLEYLEENSLMRRAAKLLKGITEILPRD